MNKLFDQDNCFLNMQDRILAQRGKSAWAKDYYCPAPCDGLVAAGGGTQVCLLQHTHVAASLAF